MSPPAYEEGGEGEQESAGAGYDGHADAGVAEVEAVVRGGLANRSGERGRSGRADRESRARLEAPQG